MLFEHNYAENKIMINNSQAFVFWWDLSFWILFQEYERIYLVSELLNTIEDWGSNLICEWNHREVGFTDHWISFHKWKMRRRINQHWGRSRRRNPLFVWLWTESTFGIWIPNYIWNLPKTCFTVELQMVSKPSKAPSWCKIREGRFSEFNALESFWWGTSTLRMSQTYLKWMAAHMMFLQGGDDMSSVF